MKIPFRLCVLSLVKVKLDVVMLEALESFLGSSRGFRELYIAGTVGPELLIPDLDSITAHGSTLEVLLLDFGRVYDADSRQKEPATYADDQLCQMLTECTRLRGFGFGIGYDDGNLTYIREDPKPGEDVVSNAL